MHANNYKVNCKRAYQTILILFLSVPTLPPNVYYVAFIITNTYGEDIVLKTTLYSPYSKIILIDGQTIRLTIPVGTNDIVQFEAEERDSGTTIKINDQDIYPIEPQEILEDFTLLTVPDKIGKVTKFLATKLVEDGEFFKASLCIISLQPVSCTGLHPYCIFS